MPKPIVPADGGAMPAKGPQFASPVRLARSFSEPPRASPRAAERRIVRSVFPVASAVAVANAAVSVRTNCPSGAPVLPPALVSGRPLTARAGFGMLTFPTGEFSGEITIRITEHDLPTVIHDPDAGHSGLEFPVRPPVSAVFSGQQLCPFDLGGRHRAEASNYGVLRDIRYILLTFVNCACHVSGLLARASFAACVGRDERRRQRRDHASREQSVVENWKPNRKPTYSGLRRAADYLNENSWLGDLDSNQD
jgi:hypothetical protein